jgi:RecA-family ATPase
MTDPKVSKFVSAAESPKEHESQSRPELLSSPLTFINTDRWDDEPAPEPEYVVPGVVPAAQVTLFTGEGGTGKSILEFQLCAAHVLSKKWLGMTPKPGPAIFLDAEDAENVMRWRAMRIVEYYGARYADARPNLHLITRVGEDAVLGAFNRKSSIVEPTARYRELMEMAGDIKPVMIGIASAANVFAGSEIDRMQVQQFVGLLSRLARVSGGAVVLIAHPSLTGINTDSGLSGSTQWHNAVRARMFLKGPKANGGEPPTNAPRLLEFRKSQYAALSDNVTVRWHDGSKLFLPVGGANFENAERTEKAEGVFIALLRRYENQKRRVSDRTSSNYAPHLFAKEKEAREANCTKEDLGSAMLELLRVGRIQVHMVGRPSHQTRELRIVGEQTEMPFEM